MWSSSVTYETFNVMSPFNMMHGLWSVPLTIQMGVVVVELPDE